MGEQARRSALFIVAVLVSLGMALRGEADVCPLPGGGAIAGRVTAAATGDPLVDAALVAERFVDGTLLPVAATTTGPTGHYQFAALVPGSHPDTIELRNRGTGQWGFTIVEKPVDAIQPGHNLTDHHFMEVNVQLLFRTFNRCANRLELLCLWAGHLRTLRL